MKKLFTLFIAMLASVSMLRAEKVKIGDLYYNLNATNYTAEVTSQNSSSPYWSTSFTTVNIPASVEYNAETYSVTSIGKSAFNGCSGLTSVTIPNSVTRIGQSAFSHCTGLTSVTIPNSVTEIKNGAFYNVANIEFYGNLDGSPWGAKSRNGYVDGYLVYSDETKTNLMACSSSAEGAITIPNSVTSIGKYAFWGCSELTSIEIPNSVTSIGEYAFWGCSELTSIEIPNGVTSIGEYAFSFCYGLTSVTIPNSVTSIGEYAFSYCHGLTSIDIPNSVTSIGKCAFSGCHGLTSIDIPNSVTTIGLLAFLNCSNLASVTIGSGVTSIEDRIFKGCTNLSSVIWNATHCADFIPGSTPFCYIRVSNSDRYDIRLRINSFTFGEDVEYIPAYLCDGMTNVPEIVVPNCHAQIGEDALANCNSRIEGEYNIVYPDTVLCYGEDLYVDGVKCDLPMAANYSQTWTRNLTTVKGCDSTISISVFWKKLEEPNSLSSTDCYDYPNTGSISYYYSIEPGRGYDYYTLNGVKNASLTNLTAGNYRLAFHNEVCEDSIVKTLRIRNRSMRVNNMYYLLDDENHTAVLSYRGESYSSYSNEYSGNITIPETITFEGEEYQVAGINSYTFSECNNIQSITLESETPIDMPYNSGLPTNCIVYVPFGSLNAYKTSSYWSNYNIHVLNPSHVTTTSGATSVSVVFGNSDEQNHIASCGIEGSTVEFAGNIIEYIGLEPNSTYNDVPFFINTKEGDREIITVSFSTTELTLTTQPSKPVSSTTAILLANTNIADIETSCGFEWKRDNAPEGFTPTKVYCPVASGQMAGRLKNLKDDVYYKYRAFYQSAAGTMYYGEWQYIFTGDVAIEFDPILYTYGASVVRENEATISGYALAGSEDFTEQGFEYWAENRANASNAPFRAPAALGEHIFVQASGISLRVTLTDLDAGTVYKYRVYGKVGDQMYYGAEQTFTTTGTYTPPTYMITFLNWDGEILQSSPVATGTMPEYTGVEPTRPDEEIDNETFTYVFSGWSPELTIVTEEATYTAQFIPYKATAIDHVQSDVPCTKVLRDGQIYILRGDKIYTVVGTIVR